MSASRFFASIFNRRPSSVDNSSLLAPEEKKEARAVSYFEDKRAGESDAMFFIRDLTYSRDEIYQLTLASKETIKDALHRFIAEMEEFFKRLATHEENITKSQVPLDQYKTIGQKIAAMKRSAHYVIQQKLKSDALDATDKAELSNMQRRIVDTCLASLKKLNIREDQAKAAVLDAAEERVTCSM